MCKLSALILVSCFIGSPLAITAQKGTGLVRDQIASPSELRRTTKTDFNFPLCGPTRKP